MEPNRVPFSTLCKVIGIKESKGNEWRRNGLLDATGRRGCGELDAIKGRILKVLFGELDRDDLGMVWHHTRKQVGRVVMGERLDLVCLITKRKAFLCTTDQEVADAALLGGSIHLLRLAAEIKDVRENFRSELDARVRSGKRGSVKAARRVNS